MRVLHVNKFLYRRGGAEGYMLDLADRQRAGGHEVELFGMDHPHNDHQRFAEHFPSQVELDPPPAGLGTRIRTAGRMIWSREAAHGMDEVLRAFRPHVVHLHNVYHQLSPSVLRPVERAGVPAVMTLHDYKLACPQYTFLANGEICEACLGGRFWNAPRRACKNGSRTASGLLGLESWIHARTGAYDPVQLFLAPSRFMASKMEEAGIDRDRIRHVTNFVDASQVAPRVGPGTGLVVAGRLSAEKGLDVLLDAMALLPDATLDVVGEGPEGESLAARAHAVAPGRVRFHGRVPKASVLEHLRSARVAVVPSRWYENQPIALLEAFAAGVPVVASDVGGLPELVVPGRTGTLVPMNDPAALAAALRAYLEDPDRAVREGREARRRVEEEFSAADHLDRLHECYSEAAARVPGRRRAAEPAATGSRATPPAGRPADSPEPRSVP
jgi:glycosyltransferase involved in cell wall biosynthesis